MNRHANTPDFTPALERLTPAQALDFVRSPFLYRIWLEEHGLPPSRDLLWQIWERADAALSAPSPGDARRRDAERLRDFVQRAGHLPFRLCQVASCCLDHGMSLTGCARHLGISRETARAHLRRLRLLEKRSHPRGERHHLESQSR